MGLITALFVPAGWLPNARLGALVSPMRLTLLPILIGFIGLRGVRLALACPELLRTQLRVLLRAFERRRLRVLLPMVNDPGDVARVRDVLGEIQDLPARQALELAR